MVTTRIRYLGFFLCLLGAVTFSFLVYTRFTDHRGLVKHMITTNLTDIPKAYRLTPASETEKGEYAAHGPSGFWVAEIYHAEGMYPKIVGRIGLGAFSPRPHRKWLTLVTFPPDISRTNAQDNAIELRRMTVSSQHRRRGIASRLMDIVVAHERTHGKKYIDLFASPYNEIASDLYEKRGWVIRRRRVKGGPATNMYAHQLRRSLI